MSMAPQNWDWVFTTLGWTLAGLSILLALWALFWDRSRGRERCPKCWYSMAGAVAGGEGLLKCPECGKEISSARTLCKTRRRWRVVALSGLLIWGATVSYRVNWPGREGFMAAVPTTALVLIVSDYTAKDALTQSLLYRLWQEPIAPWDRWLARRREVASMPDDWSEAVVHRGRWPVDVPALVEFERHPWMQSQLAERTTTMRLKGTDIQAATLSHSPPYDWAKAPAGRLTYGPAIGQLLPDRPSHSDSRSRTVHSIELPAPSPGENRYTIVLESYNESVLVARREIEIVIEGVPTVDDALTPFAGEALPLEYVLGWQIQWGGSETSWGISISAAPFYVTQHTTPYRATLKIDGQALATDASGASMSTMFWLDSETALLGGMFGLESSTINLNGLTVEIVPDLWAVLYDLDNEFYWDNHVELPLRSLPMLGYDGTATNRYLIQVSNVPLAKAWREGASSDWLELNAVKQSPPK